MTATVSSSPDLSFWTNSRMPRAKIASLSGVNSFPDEFSVRVFVSLAFFLASFSLLASIFA
jgi:hypothetical protein